MPRPAEEETVASSSEKTAWNKAASLIPSKVAECAHDNTCFLNQTQPAFTTTDFK